MEKKGAPSQFLRVYGYPRGSRSRTGTMDAVIAEGLRSPTHIAHLSRAPEIEVFPASGIVARPELLSPWIERQMKACRYGQSERYPKGRPLRSNAVALGTLVASLCVNLSLSQLILR